MVFASEKAGKTAAVDAEIAGDFLGAEASHGKHHVGVVQCPMDEDRFARLIGSEIGQLPAVVRVMDQMRDSLAELGGDQPAGIAASHVEIGRSLQHGDAIGIQARIHQGADDGRRDLRHLGHAVIEGQHDPVGRRDALGQFRIVDRFRQRGPHGGVKIDERLVVRRANLDGRDSAGELAIARKN